MMLSLSDLSDLTSLEEIKKLLPSEVMQTLTAEDEGVIANALSRATATIYAYLVGCGINNLSEEGKKIAKTALEKLTLYEISLYATVELPFEKQKEEALSLLQSFFGCQPQGQGKVKAIGIVKQDKRVKPKTWDTS
jgi:hypothetical protein